MKLICISDKKYPHLTSESDAPEFFHMTWKHLTVGKEYESINYDDYDDEHQVLIHGLLQYYPAGNFITQAQIREEKINKILNEEI